MVTPAEITFAGDRATLRQDGRILSAKIASPPGARFAIASAQPSDDGVNQPNPGFAILAVDCPVPAAGDLTLEIHLRPGG